MTHHYTIEIIKVKLFFKATYRNKKFRKIEHLRGKLDRSLMNSIGRVIPVNEDELPSFNKEFEKRVNYKIEVKNETIHTQFLNEWVAFYQENNKNLKPKVTGADVNALKSIRIYLRSQAVNDEEALDSWRMILSNWNVLGSFHKKQMDLKYINSKLNVIIREIQQQGVSTSNEVARNFKL